MKQHEPGPPMTLGNMREQGVRGLRASGGYQPNNSEVHVTNSTNRDTEIAEAKAQIADLQRQIAALTPKPAPPKPYFERPVTIVEHGPPRPPSEALPSDEQFLELQRIVLAKFPMLEPRGERGLSPDEFHVQFKRAFSWLLVIGRTREGSR